MKPFAGTFYDKLCMHCYIVYASFMWIVMARIDDTVKCFEGRCYL